MITHFFKPVKKVKVKQEKIDPYFNDTAKKVQGNGSVVKVTAEIHLPPEEGKSDVSTSTEKNHDKFVSSGDTSTGQRQKTVTAEVPQAFKREVIDLTYDNACRNMRWQPRWKIFHPCSLTPATMGLIYLKLQPLIRTYLLPTPSVLT